MDSLLAIGVGLVLRILLDTVTDNDDRVSGVLVGMWEGVVLNHFIRRMPRSFDPYLGFGFRIFVDFLFTQSLSRLALVALWSLVGMLLADIAPNIWRESGLRRLYRQVRKDVRRVERAVPRIRIKNDLPSVRLFNRSRTASSGVSGSVRSDRAAPSRSAAPSPAPAVAGPARRQGRNPPGTFPNVSGWSETATDFSTLRRRVQDVDQLGPSPSLIPTQEFAARACTDVSSSRVQTSAIQETRSVVTQTRSQTQAETQVQAQTRKARSEVRETAVETVAIATVSEMRTQTHKAGSEARETAVETVATAAASGTQTQGQIQTHTHKSESEVRETVVETIAATTISAIQTQAQTQTQTHKSESKAQEIATETVVVAAAASTSAQSIVNASCHDPPAIPDDWVDIDHPSDPPAYEPAPLSEPKPETLPEPRPPTPSRPPSAVIPPPAVETIPDIPDVDPGKEELRPPDQIPLPESRAASVMGSVFDQPQSRGTLHSRQRSQLDKAEIGIDPKSLVPSATQSTASRPPDQVPLPESRAASVIGGVYDQPQPRSALQNRLRSHLDKATSEIGVDPRSLAPIATQTAKKPSTSRSWFAPSAWGSRAKQLDEGEVPSVPPKEFTSKPASQSKPPAITPTEPIMTTTPAQVDPPASILSQPGEADVQPLLFATSPREETQERRSLGKADSTVGNDTIPAPVGTKDKGDSARKSSSLLDLPSPARTPPPPFTEFEGVPSGSVVGEAPTKDESVAQDEAPTELTEEQKAMEESRQAFLSSQSQELEASRIKLQKELDNLDEPTGKHAKELESDLEDSQKTLSAVTTRLKRKKFSEPPSDPAITEVSLTGKTVSQVQSLLASTILDMLLRREDAGPIIVQFTINRSKPLKPKTAKDARDAVIAFAKQYNFVTRSETATPGIIKVTF